MASYRYCCCNNLNNEYYCLPLVIWVGHQSASLHTRPDVLCHSNGCSSRGGGERTLKELIEAKFKKDVDTQVYENYLHPRSKELLGKSNFSTDRELALAITQRLGQADGSIYTLEALGETVFDTRRGNGCCSDYSKYFLFYAIYLGLPAREVSLFIHTTVEYLNRQTND